MASPAANASSLMAGTLIRHATQRPQCNDDTKDKQHDAAEDQQRPTPRLGIGEPQRRGDRGQRRGAVERGIEFVIHVILQEQKPSAAIPRGAWNGEDGTATMGTIKRA